MNWGKVRVKLCVTVCFEYYLPTHRRFPKCPHKEYKYQRNFGTEYRASYALSPLRPGLMTYSKQDLLGVKFGLSCDRFVFSCD